MTFTLSALFHALLIVAIVVVPLFSAEELPAPIRSVRAFFTAPLKLPPPPPPPPPHAARIRTAPKARPAEPPVFVAPTEVPDEIVIEEELGLPFEGGVPGGVEGGVAGGIVGGIVGGLPSSPPTPPPAPRVVRIGGQLVAPELVHRVQPRYPELARQARVTGVVIMEAQVDTHGHVKRVVVLRGHTLLAGAAVEAVRQWRYRPLLLNGTPTQFILTVTVIFSL